MARVLDSLRLPLLGIMLDFHLQLNVSSQLPDGVLVNLDVIVRAELLRVLRDTVKHGAGCW